LLDAPGKAVESPDNNSVEFTASSVSHKSIEAGTSFFGTAGAVRIDAIQAPAALFDQLSKWLFLDLWNLVKSCTVSCRD